MNAADRRAAILDAARSAFADRGYHETSLDSVADRAGVSKALLYEHFSSKRELYVAMLEMHVHELVERISGAVAGAEPGEARMRAGVEAFFGFVEERRGAWRIMFRNAGDPDVAVRLDRLRDEVAAAIVQLMSEEAAAKGTRLPEAPPVRRDDRPADGRRDAVACRLVGPPPQGAEGGGRAGGDGLRLGWAGADQPGAALVGLAPPSAE